MASNDKIIVPIKNQAPVVYVPQATTTYKGIVQVGNGLDIDVDGILSVDPSIPADILSLDNRVTIAEGEIDTLQLEMDNVEADVTTLQSGKVDKTLPYDTTTLTSSQEIYVNDGGVAKKATMSEIKSFVIKDLTGIGRFEVVDTLPTVGESNVVYLLLIADPYLDNNYQEYIWLTSQGQYELIGTTQIDFIDINLANTSTIDEIANKTNQKEINGHFANNGTFNYLAIRTYSENEIVKYAGNFYKSLQNENIGNTPDTATTYWEAISGGGEAPSEYWVDYAVQPAGLGTSASPYSIYTAEELAWLITLTGTHLAPSLYARIHSNIDLKGKIWTPITYPAIYYITNNDRYFTISNMYINQFVLSVSSLEEVCAGFTAYNRLPQTLKISFIDTIINVNSTTLETTNGYHIGIFAGYHYSSSGGLIDASGTKITGTIIANSYTYKGGNIIGGAIGYARKSISGFNTDVNIISLSSVGFGSPIATIGGIVGTITGSNVSVANSVSNTKIYAFGAVTSYIGGIAGLSYTAVVRRCLATTEINGIISEVGGIIGRNSSTVENCFSSGILNSTSANGGGIAGTNDSGTITNSLSITRLTDNITASFGTSNAGTITSSYYLENTVNGGNDATGLDRTIGELRKNDTFVGWDFTTPIWVNDVNVTGFNVPIPDVLKNLNLEEPKYLTARLNDYALKRSYAGIVVDRSTAVEVALNTTTPSVIAHDMILYSNSPCFSFDNTTKILTYTGNETKKFEISGTLSMEASTSSNEILTGNVYLNGTADANFAIKRKLSAPNDYGVASFNKIVVTMSTGDYIDYRIISSGALNAIVGITLDVNEIKDNRQGA